MQITKSASSTNGLTPDRILGIGFGFFAAKALTTAVELSIFSILGGNALNLAQLCDRAGIRGRGAMDFLDALVALNLLEREGDSTSGSYRNSQEARLFLDRASDRYVGGILIMAGKRLYRYWQDLGEALRTGEAQSEAKGGGKSLFDTIFADPDKLREFADAMAGLSRQNFTAFVAAFPFARYRRHVDVGASTGLLSRLVAARHDHLELLAFDLPEVIAIAQRYNDEAGLGQRITTVGGSFLSDPLPKADLITLGNILHDWSLPQKRQILAAAHAALEPGGSLVMIENFIDDERRSNSFGLLMSLNMLVEFGDAADSTAAEMEGWARDAGFVRFERLAVHGPCSALIAHKL